MMRLDATLPVGRYDSRLLHLLVATAAVRATTDGSGQADPAGWLLWLVIFGFCALLRAAHQRLPEGDARAETLQNLVAGAGLLGFLLTLNRDGLTPALAVLLMAGIAALFVMARRRQHLWLLVAAALAAVLFAAAESRSALFLPAAAWFSLAALGLLGFDHAESRRSASLGVMEADQGTGHGGALFAATALLLALPVYLFVPKPAALGWGGLPARSALDYSAEASEDGLSGTAPDADREEALPPDEDPGLDLEAPERPGGEGLANDIVMFVGSNEPVYLRGRLYETYGDDRWRARTVTPQRRTLDRGAYARSDAPAGARVRQRIEVMADLDDRLYLPPGFRRLRFPAPALDEYPDGQFAPLQRLRAGTLYSVESDPELHGGRYLVPEPVLEDPAIYLQLPADLPPRIAALAREVTAGAPDAAARAMALERHLRTQYAYSFDTVRSQGVTPLDWFLFEHRRGHCEFFASALAVMLRSVGVHTRLATGFSLGEKNPFTGYYEVRRLDAHAWVEAWIPGRGWLLLEPTPFYPLPCTECGGQVAEQLDRYLSRHADTATALSPDSLRAQAWSLLRDLWTQLRHLQHQAGARLMASAGALVGLAGLLLAGAGLALVLRRALQDLRDTRAARAVLARYRQQPDGGGLEALAGALESALTLRGRPRPPGQPFASWYRELLAAQPALPETFGSRFDDRRYGDLDPVTDGDEALAAYLDACLREQPWPRLAALVDRLRVPWQRLARGDTA